MSWGTTQRTRAAISSLSTAVMGAHGAHEVKVTFVESADPELHEIGIPYAVFDLFEADVLFDEAVADAEPATFPANAAVAADAADLEVRGVGGLGEPVGGGPGRARIELGRELHADCLVGPVVVEDVDERVEGKLLRLQVGCGRTGGVVLEGLVHALVPAVLSGFAGLDELAANTQLEEPDGEAGEAGDPSGGEGRAVVGADRLGHAVLAEDELKAFANAAFGGREIAIAADQITAEEVGDRKREAITAVASLELSLEVGSPDLVRAQGSVLGRPGWPSRRDLRLTSIRS